MTDDWVERALTFDKPIRSWGLQLIGQRCRIVRYTCRPHPSLRRKWRFHSYSIPTPFGPSVFHTYCLAVKMAKDWFAPLVAMDAARDRLRRALGRP